MAPGRKLASSLAKILADFLKRGDLAEILLETAHSFVRNILVPLALTLMVLGGGIRLLLWAMRKWILPPPPAQTRYDQAKQLYQEGKIQEALQEWKALEEYGPAYLSRACHELYVLQKPQPALQILDEATKMNKLILSQDMVKGIEGMRIEAHGMAKGNHFMAQLSANVAKEDYLGIYSS